MFLIKKNVIYFLKLLISYKKRKFARQTLAKKFLANAVLVNHKNKVRDIFLL